MCVCVRVRVRVRARAHAHMECFVHLTGITPLSLAPPHPTLPHPQTLVLRLKRPPTDKKVQWEEGVVDNEFMGKKTSKCEATSN